ncbi:MAG: extracellular solute-binding protein [Anaerolineae bacterium]|nr:extracellular solute-binding protein [Anaerolineae bacterium]
MLLKNVARAIPLILIAALLVTPFSMSTPAPAVAQEEVEVTLWTWTANKEAVYRDWFARYNAEVNPNVTFNINIIPRPNYDQTLAPALIGDEAPDFWEALPLGEVQEFYERGLILDLTPYIDEEWAAALYPSSLDYLTIDGRVLSMSMATNNVQVLYNMDRFEELGLEVPTTMDAFAAAMDAMEEAGYGKATYWASANDHAQTPFFLWGQQLFPEEFEAADRGGEEWNRDIFREILADYREYNDLWVEGVTAFSLDENNALFASGDVSAYMIGNWAVPAILSNEPDFTIGVFPVPALRADNTPAPIGSMAATWVISSDNTDAQNEVLIDFFRWATLNGQPELVSQVGLCPVGPPGESGLEESNYVTRDLCEEQAGSVPRDIFDRAARDAMAAAIQGLLVGQADPEDVLVAADRTRRRR